MIRAFGREQTASDPWRYATDAWQRSLLFIDTLRQRAEDILKRQMYGRASVELLRLRVLGDN